MSFTFEEIEAEPKRLALASLQSRGSATVARRTRIPESVRRRRVSGSLEATGRGRQKLGAQASAGAALGQLRQERRIDGGSRPAGRS